MLLEIALNTGSVVLEGAGGLPRCAFGLDTRRVSTRGMLAYFMVRLYIAVVCK